MILFLICTALTLYFMYFYWKVFQYPKGPSPYPIFGNALHITPNKLHLDLEEYRKKYGDVFTLWLMNKPIVVLMSVDPIKEALVTKGENFANRSGVFPETLFQCTDNGGVIFSNDENWREQRRTALHILRDFGVGKNIMEEQVQEQLLQFIDRIKKSPNMNAIDFRWPIQVMVANIINQLLYGYSYPHDEAAKLMEYATVVSTLISEMWESILMAFAQMCPSIRYLPYIGHLAVGKHEDKYKWCIDFVKQDVQTALKNYSSDNEPECFVQAYVQKIPTNSFLNKDQLNNVCCDFFLAGMETTTTTLRWAVLYLAQDQDIQEKIRKEIATVVGFERLPSLRDKVNLPYTNAAVMELQRLANIVPINLMRKAKNAVTVAGHRLPAGCEVLAQVWSVLMEPTVFENPTEYRPERFLEEDGKTVKPDLLANLIPFGIGKRQCAGESLARTELFLGLATFVQKFHFYPPLDGVLDLTPIYGTVLFPRRNLLRVEEVNPENYRN